MFDVTESKKFVLPGYLFVLDGKNDNQELHVRNVVYKVRIQASLIESSNAEHGQISPKQKAKNAPRRKLTDCLRSLDKF